MKQNINFFLGNIIRKHRESKNMSQEEFANYCKISRAYYGRIERGEHSITVETCQKIANALEIPLYCLFEELPE